MTPYDHKQLTELVAQAWSVLEEQPNDANRYKAGKLLRDALVRINPGEKLPPLRKTSVRLVKRDAPRTNSRPVEILPVFAQWFWSASDASNTLGINRGSIVECLRGTHETAGGYRWQYSEFTTRTGFESARPTAPARQAQPQPKTRGAA